MTKDSSKRLILNALLILMVFVAITLSIITYSDKTFFSTLSFLSLQFIHWASIIGGSWIAIVTPIYYILRMQKHTTLMPLQAFHMLGNLVAFSLITIHFTYQESVASFFGTGLALYIAVLFLVVSGLLQAFNMVGKRTRQVRFIHFSMVTAFYLVFIIHVFGTFIRP